MGEVLVLFGIAAAAGCLGTLIGAGGGFLLLPALVVLYPDEPAAALAGQALVVVALNAVSGTLAYARMRRIHLRAGLAMAAGALPGAVAGAWATAHVSREAFEAILGGVLLVGAALLVWRAHGHDEPADLAAATAAPFPPEQAVVLGAAAGFLSSFLGIGGGVLQVPALVALFGFPVHVATATSQFVMALTSVAGAAVHALAHPPDPWRLLPLALGVVPGAQLGALLSARVGPAWLVRAVATVLALVGTRLLADAW